MQKHTQKKRPEAKEKYSYQYNRDKYMNKNKTGS